MSDLISRQAAIDALNVLCQEHRYKIPGKRETYSQYNEAWQDALDRAEGAIFNLPSVQPDHNAEVSKMEIIRCKDCYWWTKQEASLQGRCALSGTYPTGAFFCGNARQKPYPCDPEKNQDCSKTGCYINGGECRHTLNREYRRDEE